MGINGGWHVIVYKLSKSYPHLKRLDFREIKVIHHVIHIIHNNYLHVSHIHKWKISKVRFVDYDKS